MEVDGAEVDGANADGANAEGAFDALPKENFACVLPGAADVVVGVRKEKLGFGSLSDDSS